MNIDDYQLFDIPLGGRYRLIPEEDIKSLTNSSTVQEILNVPSIDQITLGLLVKHNRTSRYMTVSALSEKTGIKERQLHAIEADQVERPQKRTLVALAVALGDGFAIGLKLIGLSTS